MAGPLEPTPAVKALLECGVKIPHPWSVEIGSDVCPERIAAGVVLHPGTRLHGADTSIGPRSEVGGETPATVADCRLGEAVCLKGGFFRGATFLDGVAMGSSAHVRPGTLMEEHASAGHAVGFKQTVLLPYVTAGSLINFCDVLMAGGTGSDHHSEIGSSYVHFNFTARHDKATASLLGDVPRGVMLDQPPVFLGGQGGLVGPARIGFGAVIPAGTVYRGDSLEGGTRLCVSAERAAPSQGPYDPRVYGSVHRIVLNGLVYIGNIVALRKWYEHVRVSFTRGKPWAEACCEGARVCLSLILEERLARLREVAGRMPASIDALQTLGDDDGKEAVIAEQARLCDAWPRMEDALRALGEADLLEKERDRFLISLENARSDGYVDTIHALPGSAKTCGTQWLQGIVDRVAAVWHPDAA